METDKEGQVAHSGLTTLPLELKREMLRALHNARDLMSMALTHSSMYEALRGDPGIVRQVLMNQLPAVLMPHALAILRTKKENPQTLNEVFAIVDPYFRGLRSRSTEQDMVMPLESVTLPDALYLHELHRLVEYFTVDFVAESFTALNKTLANAVAAPLPTLWAPSSAETNRISRTFYVFELYCCLLGHHRQRFVKESQMHRNIRLTLGGYRQMERFFSRYAAWENEQLASVNDHLWRILSDAFDEVAQHDVEWGKRGVEWTAGPVENGWKAHFMTFGLDFIFRVKGARTYEERHAILDPYLGFCTAHLAENLYYENGKMEIENGKMEIKNDDDPDAVFSYPTVYGGKDGTDQDTGAADALFASHQEFPDVIYSSYHERLRKLGYVFWDEARVYELNDFQDYFWLDHVPLEAVNRMRVIAMKRSFERRTAIWYAGGSGWWSEGDLSHIVWLESNEK